MPKFYPKARTLNTSKQAELFRQNKEDFVKYQLKQGVSTELKEEIKSIITPLVPESHILKIDF